MDKKYRAVICLSCIIALIAFCIGWFVGQNGKQAIEKKNAWFYCRLLTKVENDVNDLAEILEALLFEEASTQQIQVLGYAKCCAEQTHNTLFEYYRSSPYANSQTNIHNISLPELAATCDYYNYIRLFLRSMEPSSPDWNKQISILRDVYEDLYQYPPEGSEYALDYIISKCVKSQDAQSYLALKQFVTDLNLAAN